jgi:hypothetical protein
MEQGGIDKCLTVFGNADEIARRILSLNPGRWQFRFRAGDLGTWTAATVAFGLAARGEFATIHC